MSVIATRTAKWAAEAAQSINDLALAMGTTDEWNPDEMFRIGDPPIAEPHLWLDMLNRECAVSFDRGVHPDDMVLARPFIVVGNDGPSDAKIGMDDDGARTKLLGNEADTAWMSAAKSLVDMPTPS
eukprot:jgi/Tetstr1/434443/TSEL_023543.t1